MSTRVPREPFVVTDDLRQRFFAKTVSADSGCLIWTGAIQKNGYGAFKLCGKKLDSHVAAWRIAHNGVPVPFGQVVMHSCDCRACVNPEHLVIGTQSANMLQAHVDGRGHDFHARGESRPNAILNEPLVRAIRHMYVPRVCSHRRVAEILGIEPHLVRNVLCGRTWKHVEGGDATR